MNHFGSQVPHLRSPRRRLRWAYLKTLLDLRHSIQSRRPMTLPNCLRLYHRRAAPAAMAGESAQFEVAHSLAVLRALYRRHQPFRAGGRFSEVV